MAAPKPTIKQVNLLNEDTYRKQKMIAALEVRGILSEDAKKFIESGRRTR